ncbi:MAG TPA: hypothetical protein VJT67_16915 [Longimicrobiaceae bacterium]|nr:hypothetical protein [Longimicrobiaceae bacterium]
MALASRGTRNNGRFLEWKVRLFFVGAVLLFIGMAREIDLLVLLSIIVLAVAFVLRFFEREKEPITHSEESEESEN